MQQPVVTHLGSKSLNFSAAWTSRQTCHPPRRCSRAPASPRPPPGPPLQALVDFPGQIRRVISFKRLALTDFTVEMPRLAKKSVLKKALEDAGAC